MKSASRAPQAKVVVAGAGIAGMTAALYLSEAGFDVTVLERSDHLGGKFGATRGRGGAVHEHAYHFLGDWCVNFWTVAGRIGLRQDVDFLPSRGVRFLRPCATGGPLAARLTTLRLAELRTQFIGSLYGGVIPPDDMMIWFYSLLEIMAYGQDLDEKEFLNRISVNGFMRSLAYMTDLAALLHQEALMKAFAIPSYDTSARSYRRFARFFSRDQGGCILNKPVNVAFWPRFEEALQKQVRQTGGRGGNGPIRYMTSLEEIEVDSEKARIRRIRVSCRGTDEWLDLADEDHLLVTVPCGDFASIVERSATLRLAAPRLLELRKLKSKQMASFDLYFRYPLGEIPAEHVTLIDDRPFTEAPLDRKARLSSAGNRIASRFALSFVDNYQAWHRGRRKETWLNVVASDFEELQGLDREQAEDEILKELTNYLDFNRADIDWKRSDLQPNKDAPLFMNTVGSWQYRPPAGLYADGYTGKQFRNLSLAGDYCQSPVDIVCLEGAVMTARMAACAIARRSGHKNIVSEPEIPAEVSDRSLEQLIHELRPWLELAARRGFGASERLDPAESS
jgi:hypothetical protein